MNETWRARGFEAVRKKDGPRSSRRQGRTIVAVLLLLTAACGSKDEGETRTTTEAADRGPSSKERILETAQHALHATGKAALACEACHELVAGKYLPAKSWKCEECHADERTNVHATASEDSGARECWSCHSFSSPDKAPIPCRQCHRKPQGDVPAISPHDPNKPDEDCGSCHRAHEEPSLVATRCEDCHDREQVTGHTKPDIPITGCASCHGYHEKAVTASGRCVNCHRQSRARVATTATFEVSDGKGHAKCVTCHRPHRFLASEVIGCNAECHEDVFVLAQNKVKEHADCLSCHDNHNVLGSPEKSCVKCHRNKLSVDHPKDPKTGGRCTACHRPHAGPAAPLAVPCSQCHQQAKSDASFHQGPDHKGPVCRNCHQPHQFNLGTSKATLCRRCHTSHPFAHAETVKPREGHEDCFRCHGRTVAHEPQGDKVQCGFCHEDKAQVVREGHEDCTRCHEPHSTVQRRPCGECHEAQRRIVAEPHKRCINCHEPHTTAQRASCASCHEVPARTAPQNHKNCLECHEPHSTEVKTPCRKCHQDRATGIHANVKGGCLNCHRPHGPKGHASPPACRSCHVASKLPALHQAATHAKNCRKCHQSHGEQPYRHPATCLSCHEDKKEHEPDAESCITCHPFGEQP